MVENNEIRYAVSSESEKGQTLSAHYESKVYESIRLHFADARTKSLNAINVAMAQAYWEIGRKISEVVGGHPD